jgi:sugar/nucleoside kinase (ribokinase family)
MGFSGSWVKSGDLKFYTPSLKTNQIPDAGVGDLFISGFLHGYLNKASLPQCSWIGSFVASKALEKGIKKFDYLFWKEVAHQLLTETSSQAKDK